MSELTPLSRDLSVFNKLELEKPPVGVKFLFGEPEGVPRLERTLGLCEMVTEAQKGKVFYAGFADHECAGMSGKINFSVTGLTFGHIAREVGIEGNVVVSVPWDALPTMVENLEEMPFVLPAYEDGRENYSERFKRVTEGH